MSFASVHHLASPHKVEAVGMTLTERLDLDPGGRVYAPGVGRNGLFIGELAARSGTTRQAQRLGFTLGEIKEIVGIKRAGRAPCPHVRDLVRRKADELDQRLEDLQQVRNGLRHLLKRWRSAPRGAAAVCPHIEHTRRTMR